MRCGRSSAGLAPARPGFRHRLAAWTRRRRLEGEEEAADPLTPSSPTPRGRRAHQPRRGRTQGRRALQGLQARSLKWLIAMAVRDGSGCVLDLPGDAADTQVIRTVKKTTWADGGCAGWYGSPDRGFHLRGEPGLPDPRQAGLHPRREACPADTQAAAAPRPVPRRSAHHGRRPARRKRSTSPRASAAATATTAAHPSGIVICRDPDRPERSTGRSPGLVAHLQQIDRGLERLDQPRAVTSSSAASGRARAPLLAPPGSCASTRRVRRQLDAMAAARLNTSSTRRPRPAYKQLLAVERGWRDMRRAGLRPSSPHHDHIPPHPAVWLALSYK